MHFWMIERKNEDGQYIPFYAIFKLRKDARELRKKWKLTFRKYKSRITKYVRED